MRSSHTLSVTILLTLKSGDLSVMQMQNIVVWQCNIMSGPTTDEQNSARPIQIVRQSYLHHAGLRLVLTVGQMSAGHARKHLAPTEVAEALRRPLNGDGSNLSVPVGTVALAPANICRPVQPDTAPKGLPDGRGNRGRQLSQPRSPGHPKVADPYIWNRVSRPPAKYRHDDRPRHPCRQSVGQFPHRPYSGIGAAGGLRRLVDYGEGEACRSPG